MSAGDADGVTLFYGWVLLNVAPIATPAGEDQRYGLRVEGFTTDEGECAGYAYALRATRLDDDGDAVGVLIVGDSFVVGWCDDVRRTGACVDAARGGVCGVTSLALAELLPSAGSCAGQDVIRDSVYEFTFDDADDGEEQT